jgi:hypothetical protein
MNRRRAVGGLLAIAISLLPSIAVGHTARAQETSGVSLSLVSQTPWGTIQDPVIEIAVKARNDGAAPLRDLSIGITIGAAVRSRNVYEATLTGGPGLAIDARTIPQEGSLEPGGERRFGRLQVDLSEVGDISRLDSLVYPLRVDLRSAGVPVAQIDVPIIFLVRQPESPLLLSATVEVSAPIALGPDGRLADLAFEDAVAPDGTLGAEVAALHRLATEVTRPIDLVVQPSLLDQLQRLSDGYERIDGTQVPEGSGAAADATALLRSLREIVEVPSVQVVALPFSAPTLPSLLSSGLTGDLAVQEARGIDTVRAVLGVDPVSTVVRPAVGALDDEAVSAFAALGATTILGDADTVERPPQPNEFAPPPTASLAVGGQAVALVLPDPGTQALLATSGFLDDPVRAAQVTLGELAVIWREQPVPSSPRGVAVSIPSGLPARFWGALLGRLTTAPFLHPTNAEELVRQIPPPAAPSSLTTPSTARFTPAYAEAIKRERRDLLAFRSMLVRDSPIPDRLARSLLYAESAEYLGNELAGRAWIDQVNRVTKGIFASAVPDTSQVFTFTSETGTIPLLMGEPAALPLRFTLQLRSNRFRFPSGDQQSVTLAESNQIVTFKATALATGQGTIQVIVRAPSGRPIGQTQMTVRSTSVNHIAVAVTVVAALVLIGLWSRRLFRRPRA